MKRNGTPFASSRNTTPVKNACEIANMRYALSSGYLSENIQCWLPR